MCADNQSFGLTDEEYEFLQADISQTIIEWNKKNGYSGNGYVVKDGNPKPKKPSVEHVSNSSVPIKMYDKLGVWNYPLVQSIRKKHANLTIITQFEIEDMKSYES
jgi:hypothetical protein